MKRIFDLKNMLRAALMMFAVVSISFAMTSCSDDDNNGSTIEQSLKVDGKTFAGTITGSFFTETAHGTAIIICFSDGTTLEVGVGTGHFGKTIRLDQPGDGTEAYDSAEYYSDFDIGNFSWYGDNDIDEDDRPLWLLESGSQMIVTRNGNTFTVKGKFIFKGEKNAVYDGKTHTVEFSGTVTAEEEEEQIR